MNESQIKNAVRERDGYCCTLCGMTQAEHVAKHGFDLDVHRVTPGSPYATDESCITVCRSCHGPLPKSEPWTTGPLCARLKVVYREQLSTLAGRIGQRDKYRTAPSVTDLVRVAVENLLAEEKLWPPPAPKS